MKIGTSGTGKPTGALKRAYDLIAELGRTKKNKPKLIIIIVILPFILNVNTLT